MAQFRTIRKKDGSVKLFQTCATFNGKSITIAYSVSKFSDAANRERREKEAEEAARTRHNVVKDLEESSKLGLEPNPGTTFKKIVFRAGVEDYPKPFQNLRASAATDVRREYGTRAESDWIGHDAAIADEHYDMVTADELRKAAGLTPKKDSPKEDSPFDTTPDSWKNKD